MLTSSKRRDRRTYVDGVGSVIAPADLSTRGNPDLGVSAHVRFMSLSCLQLEFRMLLRDAPFDAVLVMVERVGDDTRKTYYQRRLWRAALPV